MTVATLSPIAKLNDLFRQTFTGGKVLMTRGVAALSVAEQAEVLRTVREFSAFTEGNDPHDEHDFGSFEIAGDRFFFKIDYYDITMTYGSENPGDPMVTTRVLTVMLASEY